MAWAIKQVHLKFNVHSVPQERLKQLEAKRIEKERNEKYQKLKGDAKDARQKYREKYKLDASPEPSDAEEESDDDEDDGFGATKKKEEEDPAASKFLNPTEYSDY